MLLTVSRNKHACVTAHSHIRIQRKPQFTLNELFFSLQISESSRCVLVSVCYCWCSVVLIEASCSLMLPTQRWHRAPSEHVKVTSAHRQRCCWHLSTYNTGTQKAHTQKSQNQISQHHNNMYILQNWCCLFQSVLRKYYEPQREQTAALFGLFKDDFFQTECLALFQEASFSWVQRVSRSVYCASWSVHMFFVLRTHVNTVCLKWCIYKCFSRYFHCVKGCDF